mmetsp:Transcript_43904/g.111039  ORF Transcript_43904/g.111039 Transcript_43904/m.111039 type:complete len:411 (+) Transcript_43904:337-1569(+)
MAELYRSPHLPRGPVHLLLLRPHPHVVERDVAGEGAARPLGLVHDAALVPDLEDEHVLALRRRLALALRPALRADHPEGRGARPCARAVLAQPAARAEAVAHRVANGQQPLRAEQLLDGDGGGPPRKVHPLRAQSLHPAGVEQLAHPGGRLEHRVDGLALHGVRAPLVPRGPVAGHEVVHQPRLVHLLQLRLAVAHPQQHTRRKLLLLFIAQRKAELGVASVAGEGLGAAHARHLGGAERVKRASRAGRGGHERVRHGLADRGREVLLHGLGCALARAHGNKQPRKAVAHQPVVRAEEGRLGAGPVLRGAEPAERCERVEQRARRVLVLEEQVPHERVELAVRVHLLQRALLRQRQVLRAVENLLGRRPIAQGAHPLLRRDKLREAHQLQRGERLVGHVRGVEVHAGLGE